MTSIFHLCPALMVPGTTDRTLPTKLWGHPSCPAFPLLKSPPPTLPLCGAPLATVQMFCTRITCSLSCAMAIGCSSLMLVPTHTLVPVTSMGKLMFSLGRYNYIRICISISSTLLFIITSLQNWGHQSKQVLRLFRLGCGLNNCYWWRERLLTWAQVKLALNAWRSCTFVDNP
jgi:hypothetical protein